MGVKSDEGPCLAIFKLVFGIYVHWVHYILGAGYTLCCRMVNPTQPGVSALYVYIASAWNLLIVNFSNLTHNFGGNCSKVQGDPEKMLSPQILFNINLAKCRLQAERATVYKLIIYLLIEFVWESQANGLSWNARKMFESLQKFPHFCEHII